MEQDEAISLVRRQLLYGVWYVDENPPLPPTGHYDHAPYDDSLRDYNAGLKRELEGADGAVLAGACLELLTDPDPDIRTRIVSYVNVFAPFVGEERLEEILKSRPELFEGVAPVGVVWSYDSLAKAIIAAIEKEKLRKAEVLQKKESGRMNLGAKGQGKSAASEVARYEGIAPTHFFRFFLGMMVGLFSLGFLVFCIWGINLNNRVDAIRCLNKAGRHIDAWKESHEFKKVVNRFLIAAVMTFVLGWGLLFFDLLVLTPSGFWRR